MSHFAINFQEPAWPDLAATQPPFLQVVAGTLVVNGMSSGKSSVALRLEGEPGELVVGEMSLEHLEAFVRACRARESFLVASLRGGEPT